MSVTPGWTVALCKLIQRGLGGRVRLTAVRRPKKLGRDGGTLGGAAVTELNDVRDGEEANQVHQQLEAEPCGQDACSKTALCYHGFNSPRSRSQADL